jgi:hypothetical protein
MHAAVGGGGALRAANEIEMTIAEIRRIADETMASMQSTAESETRSFSNLKVPVSAFGGTPQGKTLGRQHEAAHEVFVQTIEGVIADLREFQRNLRACADSHEDTDEAAKAALTALGRSYARHTYRSAYNYDRGRGENKHDLAVPGQGGGETRLNDSGVEVPATDAPAPTDAPTDAPTGAPTGTAPAGATDTSGMGTS